MTKTPLLAAIAVGALTFAGSQAVAQPGYRMSPAQSLGNTCEDVQSLDSGYVTAVCRDNAGRYRWSSIYYPYCRSDLSNRDGVLSCVGAEGRGGEYIERPGSSSSQSGSVQSAIIGAIAGALLGGADGGSLYAPGSRYPAWGETGYGDPRYDPRFGEQGWGYGSSRDQWVSISRRGEWLERRIAQGERNGSLTRNESVSLRRDLSGLVSLERRYSAGGLSNGERADLDRRFDSLSLRIQTDRRDGQTSGWTSINQRQADLDARIDAGVRDRSLSQAEARRLRADFQVLARMEADYRRNGLTNAERADLDRRFDALSERIRDDRQDSDESWTSINQRQADLDARIDAGVRDRSLSRTEAASLRADFQALARMEADYRRNGLTNAERAELDRRFDALSERIRDDRQDSDGAWTSINQRQADLDARIDAGVRDRSLSRTEAASLRADFQALARMEADYRRNGLTNAERADLDRRFDALSERIRGERRD